MDAVTLVTMFTPLLIYAAVELAQKIIPVLRGGITLLAVPVLSAGVALLTQLFIHDAHFWIQLIAGFGGVFLDQLVRLIKGEPVTVLKQLGKG